MQCVQFHGRGMEYCGKHKKCVIGESARGEWRLEKSFQVTFLTKSSHRCYSMARKPLRLQHLIWSSEDRHLVGINVIPILWMREPRLKEVISV